VSDSRRKIGTQHVVSGDEWLLGKETQDREWQSVRREFDKFIKTNGLTLIGEPKEETHYDEEARRAILRRWGWAR
jgi:hypothetical protein